ncbi:hypothetical protein [Sphingopyxis witflariensis]|uniref:hypothetical protein n=1 Tax=Sphingopyxis witflariensis TaxID=173675 RepID=UPI0011817AEF|nr:hypothetical protein [Sphingopyxis witflariensis]
MPFVSVDERSADFVTRISKWLTAALQKSGRLGGKLQKYWNKNTLFQCGGSFIFNLPPQPAGADFPLSETKNESLRMNAEAEPLWHLAVGFVKMGCMAPGTMCAH